MSPQSQSLTPLVRPRSRRSVQKSFTGCAKCKARKIKCDETKPICKRCSDKGFACPGFPSEIRLRWSRKHEFENMRPETFAGQSIDMHIPFSTDDLDDTMTVATSPGNKRNSEVRETSTSRSIAEKTLPSPEEGDESEVPLQVGGGNAMSLSSTSPDDTFTDEAGSTPSWIETFCQFRSPVDPEIFQHAVYPTDSLNSLSNLEFDATESEHRDAAISTRDFDLSTARTCATSEPIVPVNDEDVLIQPITSSLPTELIDTHSSLIQAYFITVCPRYSTFDSGRNLFRSFVSDHWQTSDTLFYTMLSMSAAKLGYHDASYHKAGVMYQTLALQSLSTNVARQSCWTTELLVVMLMLGLSACWHVITDLGVAHLRALRQASEELGGGNGEDGLTKAFLRDALVYWEMVICFMDGNEGGQAAEEARRLEFAANGADPGTSSLPPQHPSPAINPHPWSSVASQQQRMFTRVARVINQVHSYAPTSFPSMDPLNDSKNFLAVVSNLESEIWDLKLPALHEIANTGDEKTPAIHHLLIAEAYMFANLYQLYTVFPSLWLKRRNRVLEDSEFAFLGSKRSWAQYQAFSWFLDDMDVGSVPPAVRRDDRNSLRSPSFLGLHLINRIEQIPTDSGTACLHSLLLLIASPSLCSLPQGNSSLDPSPMADEREIARLRRFVLGRLEYLASYYMSERVAQARTVVLEILKRVDVGVGVFWLDVLKGMGVCTVIG